MENLKEKLQEFIELLKEEQKSPKTIMEYERDVLQMLSFMEENGFTDVKKGVLAFRNELREIEIKPNSVNRKVASCNRFLEFADIHLKLRREKIAIGTIENLLTQKEYERICKKLEEFEEYQILAIVRTLAGTGIRFSELKNVTVEACKKKLLAIRGGKGDKSRKVAIIPALANYLLSYAKDNGIRSGMIFVTRNNTPISLSQFSRKLKELTGQMRGGLSKEKVHAHAFRHLFAIQVLQKTGNISQVQALLGHSNPATTMIYLRTSEAELKDAVESISNEVMSGMKKKSTIKKKKK